MTYEEIKKMIEDKGFGCVKVDQSGATVYAEIYSKNGKKILETTNGEKWNEQPIAIAVNRLNDYVETSEPIEPFEKISEPIKEEEV